jgi:hypothetical protein
MRKSLVFGGAGFVAVAIALLSWRCGGASEKPPREPGAEDDAVHREASPAHEPDSSSTSAAELAPAAKADPSARGAASSDPVAAPSPSGANSTDAGSSAQSRINAALSRDPKDLELFSRIERELKRTPPPEVIAITDLRARGASRDELLSETRRRLANDFQLRALVVRWIDEVAPASAGATKKTPPVPSVGASASSHVRPIQSK